MSRHLLLFFALSAGRAFAQDDGLGLDLSDTAPKKEEPKKEAEPKKASTPHPSDDAAPSAPAAKNTGSAVERDITQDDRVKSVQKKLYLKRYRFELAPYFMVSLNDPYYTKIGGAVRAAFHLSDTLALSARGSIMKVLSTEDVRVAKKVFNSQVYRSVPIWSVMGDFEWSPFYGKVAFGNTIVHLDGFVIAGGGAVATETTPKSGFKPAFDIGGGLRFVARDWVAVNASLINTTYVDNPAGTTHGATQNMLMMMVGMSIFIPFKSTFREAE
ncbi:MAG: outer membrane beta-barrel domain-containing protein [Archangiaceae bacterium]|nr:outer membrane beta-barrel domain-containing protein [Archangiaceae bacterium]